MEEDCLLLFIGGVILYLFAFIFIIKMEYAKRKAINKQIKIIVMPLTPVGDGLKQYSLSWYSYSVWSSSHVALG